MNYNILIVDGNSKSSSQEYTKLGFNTQYEEYFNLLNEISPININIDIIHPTWEINFLKKGINLDDFHGVVWTGSVLNIYDEDPTIKRQIDLAKLLLTKKNKIFGSCWGLQVLATAAGGSIHKNPRGLEAIISKNILLNQKGTHHPMYINKPKKFDSFCWHYDEIYMPPPNSTILASNKYSQVQAISFTRNLSEVWAVQYHPEFSPFWVSKLMEMRKKILIDNKVYSTLEDYENMKKFLSNIDFYQSLGLKLDIQNSIVNSSIRCIELSNWLSYLFNKIK